MSSNFEGLFQTQDETLEKILLLMLDESKGLPMKTDIHNPLSLSRLETIAYVFNQDGYKEVAEVLNFFVHSYRVNRVSLDRKSRSEIISAIEGLKKEDRSLADKLLSKEPRE